MLNGKELEDSIESLNFPEKGRQLIDRIINSPPARAVRTGPKNRSGHYASQKMGVTIQYESGHYELALIRTWEHDDSVIGFWDQPVTLKIPYVKKDGNNHAILYTPDFFVIWRTTAGFVECKTEEKLARLAKEEPNRYYKGDDGSWHNLWAEKYMEQFGLSYWIMTEANIDRTYLRNLDFLEDYIHEDPQAVDKETRIQILAHVASRPAILLSDLIGFTLQANLSTDLVYIMIMHEILYVDLSAAALAERDRVYVFVSEEAAREYNPSATLQLADKDFIDVVVGNTILCDGKPVEIVNIGENEVWLRSENKKVGRFTHSEFEELFRKGLIQGLKSPEEETIDDEVNRIISEASPKELEEANRRVEFVHRYLAGERFPQEIIPERTLYNHLAAFRAAETAYGSGYLGLIPGFHTRGNRRPRFDDFVLYAAHTKKWILTRRAHRAFRHSSHNRTSQES